MAKQGFTRVTSPRRYLGETPTELREDGYRPIPFDPEEGVGIVARIEPELNDRRELNGFFMRRGLTQMALKLDFIDLRNLYITCYSPDRITHVHLNIIAELEKL